MDASDDLLAILAADDDYEIVRFAADRTHTVILSGGAAQGFSAPGNLNSDSAGNLCVSNFMGLQQRVYRIDPAGNSEVYVQPSDPTGIGSSAITADGTLIYVAKGLFRYDAATGTSTPFIADLKSAGLAAFQTDHTIPAGAIQEDVAIASYSFAMDPAGTVHIPLQITYLYKDANDNYEQAAFDFLAELTASGQVTLVQELDHRMDHLVWKNGSLYYIMTDGAWKTHIVRR